MTQYTTREITSLLTQTGQAHHKYEQTVLKGIYDQNWPVWYAEYAIELGLGKLLSRLLTPTQLGQILNQLISNTKRKIQRALYNPIGRIERIFGQSEKSSCAS